MIVHGREQERPAGAFDAVAWIAVDAMTRTHDPTQLLGIKADQVPGTVVLIAND